MSTSVKLSTEDKAKLEKLQALVTLKSGTKATQQEILSTLIRGALEKGEEFVESTFRPSVPINDEGYERLLALVEDWGVKTSWEDVDRALYGTRKERRRRS